MASSHVWNALAGGFAVFFILHVSVWRFKPSSSPRIVVLAVLGAFGMLVSIGINLLLSGLNAFELCTVLWIHFSLVIFYMFLYVHLARSVSVTLVSWLYRSGDQGLKVETLVQRYSASSRFEDRIQVMHDGGLLHLTQNTATLTPKGRLLALVSELLGRALGEGLKG